MPFLIPIFAVPFELFGITGAALTTLAEVTLMASVEMGLRAVTGLLTSKPQAAGVGTQSLATRGLDITSTNATKPRDLIYGFVGRQAGTIVFRDFTGANNQSIHLVIALAGHQVAAIGDPYILNYNEAAPLDGSGNCSSGRFAGKLHCEKFLGSSTQAACATLVSTSPTFNAFPNGWTTNHRLRGCAYVYVRLDWDENVWNQGFPDIRFDITGKNDIYDPRTATTGYTDNPVLCLRDYFTWKDGVGCTASEVNDVIIAAEANVCDEAVSLASGGTEPRFTCDGATDLGVTPTDIIKGMLSSCAGTPAYLSGQWAFYAGHWRGTVGSITDDDCASGITINARQTASSLYNGVKGLFVSAANNYQTADFPAYYHSPDRGYATDDYLAEDGGSPTDRRWKDIQLPFTTSPSMAQRLAKIDLECHRRQKTLSTKTKMTKFAHQPPDVLNFTHTRFGSAFTNKTFMVSDAQMTLEQSQPAGGGSSNSQDSAPVPLMNFTLREIDANCFAWSTAEEAPFTSGGAASDGTSAPPAPLIAQQLLAVSLGLQFAFNYDVGVPVDGYWIYRSSSSDVTTARRFAFIAQSRTLGVETYTDLVGPGVTFYYWVSAINGAGESALTPTFSGATSALGGTHINTTYRPSTSSGGFSNGAAAYDNNLSSSSLGQSIDGTSVSHVWSGFSAISGTPISITLRAVHSFAPRPGAFVPEEDLEYSTDGGASWTGFATYTGILTQTTDSASLATSINLTQLQVRQTVSTASDGDPAHNIANANMYETWVEVVT